MRNESVQHTLDKFVLRVRRRQDTVFVLLDDLLVKLLARLLFCAGTDDVEAPTTRDLYNSSMSCILSNHTIVACSGANLQVRPPNCMHRSHQPRQPGRQLRSRMLASLPIVSSAHSPAGTASIDSRFLGQSHWHTFSFAKHFHHYS